jgi:hypothetical protein
METITGNVSSDVARSFQKADRRDKNRVELYINAWLNEIFSKQSANKRLWEIMKTSSVEAKKNGFKPEMLEEILKDVDQ